MKSTHDRIEDDLIALWALVESIQTLPPKMKCRGPHLVETLTKKPSLRWYLKMIYAGESETVVQNARKQKVKIPLEVLHVLKRTGSYDIFCDMGLSGVNKALRLAGLEEIQESSNQPRLSPTKDVEPVAEFWDHPGTVALSIGRLIINGLPMADVTMLKQNEIHVLKKLKDAGFRIKFDDRKNAGS